MPRRPPTFRQRIHGFEPFGWGETKPHHFREMLRVAWQNRDNLGHAWRVLTRGVCDGCALGTTGLSDWTIDGTHLCMVRLELLRLNTMGAMDPARLADAAELGRRTSRELRELGRLGHPMRRRRGERGFTRVSFDELWADVGPRWRGFAPERTAMYLTSRGLTNEVYYAAQKVMRYLGSANVDNSARLCHSPSTAGLKTTLGVAATTCSYRDFYEADVIVFFGSNPANDQPVALKYLAEAKKRGARILVVNAYREPGMERYWIPSNLDSALFGSRIADRFFLVKVGGDMAFVNAVAKVLIARGWAKEDFLRTAVTGWAEYKRGLEAQPMDELLALAGVELADVEAFALELGQAELGIFVWSMGITQHARGAETIQAMVSLGLLREYVGRTGSGMMPIRGHSGVQGGAEMGAYSTALPGGLPVDKANAARFSELWGFDVPARPGLTAVDALEAAGRGAIDGYYCVGGNFLETMPAPERVAAALGKIGLRLHSDIVLTTQMLIEPADTVYLLPARTRYEQEGGGTETSTERRVIFSPHIPGHEVGEARSEVRLLLELAEAVRPGARKALGLEDGAAIRADIARAVPTYAPITGLSKKGDQFQWGGAMLCTGRRFPTSDGRAHLVLNDPRGSTRREKTFVLCTRRGKQFNSMVQAERDPLTGAARDHVFIAHADAARLGIRQDQPLMLKSKCGTFMGRAFLAPVAAGTLQGHWPEVNALIAPGIVDPAGGVPDYNAEVELEA